MTRWGLINGLLLVAVVVSGLAVVHARHSGRNLYNELQRLETRSDQLKVIWSQLQLEQAAWSEPGRVERIARERLGMNKPDSGNIVLIEL